MTILIDPTIHLDEPTARKLVKALFEDMTAEHSASRKIVVPVMQNPGALSSPRAQQRFMDRALKAGGRTVLHSLLDTGKKGRFRYGFDYWKPRETLTEMVIDESGLPDPVAPKFLCAEYVQRDTRSSPVVYHGRNDRIGYLEADYTGFRHFALPVHALARLIMRAGCLSAAAVIDVLQANWPVLATAATCGRASFERMPVLGQRGWLVPCATREGVVYFVMNRKDDDIIVPTVLDFSMVEPDAMRPLVDSLNRRDDSDLLTDAFASTPAAAKKLPAIRSETRNITQNAVLTNAANVSYLVPQP